MKSIVAFLFLLLPLTACSWSLPDPGAAASSVSATPSTPTTTPSPSPTAGATKTATKTVVGAYSAQLQPATTSVPTVSLDAATTLPSPLPPVTTTSTTTPTMPPTLPPATPMAVDTYRLRDWTPREADALIAQLEAYPETLTAAERGLSDVGYYDAFRYATLAQLEALYRFPNAPQAQRWRWELAYNYVRARDGRATPYYASLFQEALQASKPASDALERWLSRQEPRLTYSLTETDVPAGFTAAHLVQLRAVESGSFLWLLRAEDGYQVYPLAGEGDFDLPYGAGLSYDLTDVTGDGIRDLVSIHAHQPGLDLNFYYTELVLYDLSQVPPQRLQFQPSVSTHLGWGDRDSWTVVRSTNGGTRFRLRGLLSHRCQAVEFVSDYGWDGEYMQLTGEQYNVRLDTTSNIQFCLPFIYTAAENGNHDALQYLAALAAEATSRGNNGQANEWRYRLALYYALAGNYTQASVYLTAVISEPVQAETELVTAAARFQESYQSPADLYRACAADELCNEQLALERLVGTLPPPAYALVTEYLDRWGVPVNRIGFVDLDDDGTLEQWVLVNRPDYEMAVWLLLRTPERLRALYVDTITRNDTHFILERLTPVQNRPIIHLQSGNEERLFTIYQATGEEPLVTLLRPTSENESGNFTAQFLKESQAALLAAGAQPRPSTPQEVVARLLAYQDSPAYDCEDAAHASLCADYAYTIALAYDLAGEAVSAVQAYQQLWRDYPESPLTTIVRSKLQPAPSATPTPPSQP